MLAGRARFERARTIGRAASAVRAIRGAENIRAELRANSAVAILVGHADWTLCGIGARRSATATITRAEAGRGLGAAAEKCCAEPSHATQDGNRDEDTFRHHSFSSVLARLLRCCSERIPPSMARRLGEPPRVKQCSNVVLAISNSIARKKFLAKGSLPAGARNRESRCCTTMPRNSRFADSHSTHDRTPSTTRLSIEENVRRPTR